MLAAACQRRDLINAQLPNVREMLATLSGTSSGAPVEPAVAEEAPGESAETPEAPAEADVAESEGVSEEPEGDDVTED